MAGCSEQNALLLGLVEVTLAMKNLRNEERIQVAQQCHDAVCGGAGRVMAPGILGRVETGYMGVKIHVDKDSIQVLNNEYVVSRHKLESVSVMTVIRKTPGHLVFVGKCQKKEQQRLAVVLDMMSDTEAELLIQDYRHKRQVMKTRLIDMKSKVPPPLPNTPPPSTGPPICTNLTLTMPHHLVLQSLSSPTISPIVDKQKDQFVHLPDTQEPPPLPDRKPSSRSPLLQTALSPTLPPRPPNMVATPLLTCLSPFNFPQQSGTVSGMTNTIPDSQINPGKSRNENETEGNMKIKTAQVPGGNQIYEEIQSNHEILGAVSMASGDDVKKELIYNTIPPQLHRLSISSSDDTVATRANQWPPPNNVIMSEKGTLSSDDGDDTIYEEEEEYYEVLGINLRETERIYMRTSMIDNKQQTTQTSFEEDIVQFLRDEHKYLYSIGRIRDARKSLKPQLQNLLRGTDTLATVHNDMYEELYDGYRSCSRIAEVFISRKDQLKNYEYYLMNAPKINKYLEDLPEAVTQQLPTLREDIRCSYKRLHFYFMNLEKMLRSAPPEDREIVQEAVEMLREMNRRGDSGILIAAVKSVPFDLHLFRPLLLHNSFTIRSSFTDRGRISYRVLLFVEMIVVTVPKKEQYEYQEHLPINQVNFLIPSNTSKREFSLELVLGGQKKNKEYTFCAPSMEARDVWVEEINRLLKELAEKIKSETLRRLGYSSSS
ncbi:uncharacterized protein LOC121870029 [Homarus americanus]|nr:uncharacterized protein LOC121870029 [Homarus americanus]